MKIYCLFTLICIHSITLDAQTSTMMNSNVTNFVSVQASIPASFMPSNQSVSIPISVNNSAFTTSSKNFSVTVPASIPAISVTVPPINSGKIK